MDDENPVINQPKPDLHVYFCRIAFGVLIGSIVLSFIFGIWSVAAPNSYGGVGVIIFSLIGATCTAYIAYKTKFLTKSLNEPIIHDNYNE